VLQPRTKNVFYFGDDWIEFKKIIKNVQRSGVVINPTILPTRKRNTPFAIPNNTSLRYDIIMM